jgi:hypothetical protein
MKVGKSHNYKIRDKSEKTNSHRKKTSDQI